MERNRRPSPERKVQKESKPRLPRVEVVRLGQDFDLFPPRRTTVSRRYPTVDNDSYYTSSVILHGEDGLPDLSFRIGSEAHTDNEFFYPNVPVQHVHADKVDLTDPFSARLYFFGQLKDKNVKSVPKIIDRLGIEVISPHGIVYRSVNTYTDIWGIPEEFHIIFNEFGWVSKSEPRKAASGCFELTTPKDFKEATRFKGRFILFAPSK